MNRWSVQREGIRCSHGGPVPAPVLRAAAVGDKISACPPEAVVLLQQTDGGCGILLVLP